MPGPEPKTQKKAETGQSWDPTLTRELVSFFRDYLGTSATPPPTPPVESEAGVFPWAHPRGVTTPRLKTTSLRALDVPTVEGNRARDHLAHGFAYRREIRAAKQIEQHNRQVALEALDEQERRRLLKEWAIEADRSRQGLVAGKTAFQAVFSGTRQMPLADSIGTEEKRLKEKLGPLASQDLMAATVSDLIRRLAERDYEARKAGSGLKRWFVPSRPVAQVIVDNAEGGFYRKLTSSHAGLFVGQETAVWTARLAADEGMVNTLRQLNEGQLNSILQQAGQRIAPLIQRQVMAQYIEDGREEIVRRLAQQLTRGRSPQEIIASPDDREVAQLCREINGAVLSQVEKFRETHFSDIKVTQRGITRPEYQLKPKTAKEGLLSTVADKKQGFPQRQLAFHFTTLLFEDMDGRSHNQFAQVCREMAAVFRDAATTGDIKTMRDPTEKKIGLILNEDTQRFIAEMVILRPPQLLAGTTGDAALRPSRVLADVGHSFTEARNAIRDATSFEMNTKIADNGDTVILPLVSRAVLQTGLLMLEPLSKTPAERARDTLIMNSPEVLALTRDLLDNDFWIANLGRMPTAFILAMTGRALAIEEHLWEDGQPQGPFAEMLIEKTAQMCGVAIRLLAQENEKRLPAIQDAGRAGLGLAAALVKILSPDQVRRFDEIVKKRIKDTAENPKGEALLLGSGPWRYYQDRVARKLCLTEEKPAEK